MELMSIVRPISGVPISGVPKYGEWRGVWKKCSTQMVEKVGVGNITGSLFWHFHVLSWFMGGQKLKILFLQNTKSATSKCGLKPLLPSLVDLFDRCFSHKTGESTTLVFPSLKNSSPHQNFLRKFSLILRPILYKKKSKNTFCQKSVFHHKSVFFFV